MIKPEQLVVGLLVWWANDSWSCLGVITKVDKKKNTFRVKTFDTMDETDLFINQLSGDDKSRLVEMETATEEKILRYLQEQEDLIKKAILQKEHELGQLRGLTDQYFKKIKILRKELSLKSEYSILPKT